MRLFLSAFIAFLIVFPITMITIGIRQNPKKRRAEAEMLKKLAIERGHVVTANRIKIKTFSAVSTKNSTNHYTTSGIYEYFYNGKRYIYKFHDDSPAMEMTLYFVSDPRKAAVAGALSTDRKVLWPFAYMAVLAVVYLLTYL